MTYISRGNLSTNIYLQKRESDITVRNVVSGIAGKKVSIAQYMGIEGASADVSAVVLNRSDFDVVKEILMSGDEVEMELPNDRVLQGYVQDFTYSDEEQTDRMFPFDFTLKSRYPHEVSKTYKGFNISTTSNNFSFCTNENGSGLFHLGNDDSLFDEMSIVNGNTSVYPPNSSIVSNTSEFIAPNQSVYELFYLGGNKDNPYLEVLLNMRDGYIKNISYNLHSNTDDSQVWTYLEIEYNNKKEIIENSSYHASNFIDVYPHVSLKGYKDFNGSVVIRPYGWGTGGTAPKIIEFAVEYYDRVRTNVEDCYIYNKSDSNTKIYLCERLPHEAKQVINEDGSGSFTYTSRFNNSYYRVDTNYYELGSHDNASAGLILDNASSEVLWHFKTYYPIAEHPTLRAKFTENNSETPPDIFIGGGYQNTNYSFKVSNLDSLNVSFEFRRYAGWVGGYASIVYNGSTLMPGINASKDITGNTLETIYINSSGNVSFAGETTVVLTVNTSRDADDAGVMQNIEIQYSWHPNNSMKVCIAKDNTSFYPVDEIITNDEYNSYILYNKSYVDLRGETNFYLKLANYSDTGFKVDCSSNDFIVNAELNTRYKKNLPIYKNTSNSYVISMNASGSVNANVSAVYRDRWFA